MHSNINTHTYSYTHTHTHAHVVSVLYNRIFIIMLRTLCECFIFIIIIIIIINIIIIIIINIIIIIIQVILFSFFTKACLLLVCQRVVNCVKSPLSVCQTVCLATSTRHRRIQGCCWDRRLELHHAPITNHQLIVHRPDRHTYTANIWPSDQNRQASHPG